MKFCVSNRMLLIFFCFGFISVCNNTLLATNTISTFNIQNLKKKRGNIPQILKIMKNIENKDDVLFTGWKYFWELNSNIINITHYILEKEFKIDVNEKEIFNRIETTLKALIDFKKQQRTFNYYGLLSMYEWKDFDTLINKAAIKGDLYVVSFLFAIGVKLREDTILKLEERIGKNQTKILKCYNHLLKIGWFEDIKEESSEDLQSEESRSGSSRREAEEGDDSRAFDESESERRGAESHRDEGGRDRGRQQEEVKEERE
ncbi:MAG: hypothetical protein LBS83_02235, partial [Holosporales bacterium]|nr:hypothetical protein [Holosporales bacterium]